ncbi:hypothetical protein [Paenibacillus sp. PL91]|uniref:hypothetical protein n=1 Tax=Paenibacillus sp. PL91 TaxID=2729538 RepID=UPI00145F34B7|nr:hypothetical protein [Paenibacillus sp. PL91]MBC9203060.1 hypothetical protein [Paenibacillus sp. PL91]
MAERIVVLMVIFGGMLLHYWFVFRNKIKKREKAVYFLLLLIGLYLGMDYALNKNWLDFNDMIKPVFGGVSKEIDDFLNVNK